jgi:hypothetical protein
MPQVSLAEAGEGTATATLDGSGNGIASAGPTGPGESWDVASVAVIASSNTNEATCKVYAGPAVQDQFFRDITVDGSTGDATDRCNGTIPRGWKIWASWSGGDPGATATLIVSGTKAVP